MVIDEPNVDTGMTWVDAVRGVCDEILNSTVRYGSQPFAHPAMSTFSGSGRVIGFLFVLPFLTTALMTGKSLVIKLRANKVDFLLTLNGVNRLCQACV
jgi:hypothetical protein